MYVRFGGGGPLEGQGVTPLENDKKSQFYEFEHEACDRTTICREV